MTINTRFEEIIRDVDSFTFPESTDRCKWAQEFHDWAETTLIPIIATDKPTEMTVNQAMLSLAKQYFALRRIVPKSHRDHRGQRGHICIYQVFVNTFQQLETMELTVIKPLIHEPPPPPPPEVVDLDGTLIALKDV